MIMGLRVLCLAAVVALAAGRVTRVSITWGQNATRCPATVATFDDTYTAPTQSGAAGTGDVFIDESDVDATLDGLGAAGCTVVSTSTGVPPPQGYHNPEELAAAMAALASRFSDLAEVIDLTRTLGVEPTAESRSIFALKISDNVAVDEAEQNLLVVAEHHARELAGPETALHVATMLLEEYSKSDTIRTLVDDHQIYIVWSQNPDGLAYVWSTDSNWRKNRQVNGDGTVGVDLNRNYPFGWGPPFTCGGSETPSSSTYRGVEAASEPETRTMIAFQNDRNFAKVLDLHAYARDVRQNYAACASLPDDIDAMYTSFTATVARRMDYSPVRSCCTGGNIANAFHDHGSLSLLVEIGTAFQPPYAQTVEEIATIWPGIIEFLSLRIPTSGIVVDGVTGDPIAATITLIDIRFEYGEIRKSGDSGLFFLWVPEDKNRVYFEAPGYAPVTVELTTRETIRMYRPRPQVAEVE